MTQAEINNIEASRVADAPTWTYDTAEIGLVRCPVCFTVVYDDDAHRICPACCCDVDEAGGWQ